MWLMLLWSVSAQTMRVHFIDVGQGASTLVEFPCAAIIVDTGGEKNNAFSSNDRLMSYLDEFFSRRPELNKTFHSIILTHPHIDHTRGVASLLSRFNIRNAITNGQVKGSGKSGQMALHRKVADSEATDDPAQRIGLVEANVKRIPKNRGQTNDIIDPVKCNNVDPKITLLWGASDQNPGWTQDAFDDENNHSVVMRIDFGASSLLITGDLEDVAIQDLVEHYRGSNLLDVDVYQVGHHGSANATTEEFLAAITPEIAVIAMGSPTREFPFTAFEHGHPRKVIVDSLERHVSEPRDPITVRVATGQHTFEPKRLRRAIYATGWDGSVVLEADTAGNWKNVKKAPSPAPSPVAVGPSNLIDINRASVEELSALPRIGRVRAEAIVAHRTRLGRFNSVEGLEDVAGIGPATIILLKSLVTAGPN
jgi:competence protein ComEC